MNKLAHLFDKNRAWSEGIRKNQPEFFAKLSRQQSPEYLWVGCSDSRVPANQIIGLLPGEVFVHRNIANVVVHTDLNCLSVAQFAVDVLKVKHIIVCGHYGCGGVKAAMDDARFGLIDNWLRHIQDMMRRYTDELESINDETTRLDKLCELNVIEQVVNAGETTVVRNAWERGQDVTVHGWIYSIADGIYQDLNVSVKSDEQLDALRKSTYTQRLKTGAVNK